MKLKNLALVLCLSTGGCSDDDDDSEVGDAAATIDAGIEDSGTMDAATGGINALGQLCGEGRPDCPADHTCAQPGLVGASTNQGYCTPTCESDSDCTDEYDGPGSPSCFLPPECAISCSTPMTEGECPEGLTCLPTGGPTSACGVAE